MRCWLTALAIVLACSSDLASQSPADLVIRGGKIVTLDSEDRIVAALAVRDGKVIATGTDQQLAALVGPQTRVLDLHGRTVIPGIIETHCHPIGVARSQLQQPYVQLSSVADIQRWIQAQAKRQPEGSWVRVPRVDITRLKERRHPTPAELDAACKTHPVVLTAARKHALNSLGFQQLGISREKPKVEGGQVLTDEQGMPVLVAGGDALLRERIPRQEFTPRQTQESLEQVLRVYNSVGITSIFDRANNREGYQTYAALREKGRLPVRVTVTFRQQFKSGEQVRKYVQELGLEPGSGDAWLKPGPLKITVDGGIHWGNTYLSEPYGAARAAFYRLPDPQYRGDLRFSVEQMSNIFSTAAQLGWQMCCHVTGDGGIERVLGAVESASENSDIARRRFTLVHAYFPSEKLAQRAATLGMGVDTQCFLYYKDADAIAAVYGKTWAERFIGLGQWCNSGVPVAINSDHMIGIDPNRAMNAFNPFLQMYIAVSRRDERGNIYGAKQKLSRVDALRAMTTTAAWLSFDEQRLGSLEPGKLADLVVLDRDYLSCPEDEIRQIQVLQTFVEGKQIYPQLESKRVQ